MSPDPVDSAAPSRGSAPRPRARLLAWGLVMLCACGGEAPLSDPDGRSTPRGIADGTIRVLQLNRLQGHAESVPCADGNPSPLVGAALLRDEFAAEGDLAILACVGETLNRNTTITPSKAAMVATRARADEVLAAMGDVGVDLWVPGHADLGMGFDEVVGRAHELGITVVLTNASVGAREDVSTYVVLDNGGPRVACLGVIPTRVARPEGQGGTVSYQGVTLLNAVDSVRQAAARIRASGEADFIAVFSNLSQLTTTKLMDIDDVDFVFASQEASSRVTPVIFRGSTASFAARGLGQEVGLSTIRIVDGNLQLADLSHRHVLPDDIARDAAWFGPIARMYGTEDLDSLTAAAGGRDPQGFRDRASLYLENIQALEVMNHWGDSSVDHQLAELPEQPPNHPAVERFDRLGATIDAALLAAELPPPSPFPAVDSDMPAPESCGSCHEPQYRFWRGTAHAEAFTPVRESGRVHDPSCLRCHTTGYALGDGFSDPRTQDPLHGISCLACHEASSAHVNNPRLVMMPTYTWPTDSGGSCTVCHTPRRSPGFDPMIEMPSVSCPSLDSSEPLLMQVAEGALEAVDRRRENGHSEQIDDYVEAYARIALGHPGGVEQLVELEWDNGVDAVRAIQSARMLDREGHSAEAQQVLRRFLESQMGEPSANRAHIELLLFPTDETARDAELALSRIRMLNPEESDKDILDLDVLRIDALYLLGRTEEAQAELDTLATIHHNDVRVLQRLHRWWPERLEPR